MTLYFVWYCRLVNLIIRLRRYSSRDLVRSRKFARISIGCQRFDTKWRSWQLDLKSWGLDKPPPLWTAQLPYLQRNTNNTRSSLKYKLKRRRQIVKWLQNSIFEIYRLLTYSWVCRTPLPSVWSEQDQAKIQKSHIWSGRLHHHLLNLSRHPTNFTDKILKTQSCKRSELQRSYKL